jgi:glycosyltransferase involved in cell wall biosynthesis
MTVRLAVVRDSRAEGWPSMDLCGDQLLAHLPAVPGLAAADLEAPFARRASRLPGVGGRAAAFNLDRLVYRHRTLMRFVRRHAPGFDVVHVVDHSYAHAALAVPPGRCGVYCHDLDAFRSVLDPARERRPWWFRALARRTLRGLRAAAVVFHNSAEVGRELAGVVDPGRLVHAPLGVAAEFTPAGPAADLPGMPPGPFLLHVGSHLPRKRVDVLLDAFAAVHKHRPGVSLVQVGPPFGPAIADRVGRLGVGGAVVKLAGLTRPQLADLYRRAAAVLVPSEAEGFGLPVIEALACGAAVVASDIPVLREVGGDAVLYRPVGDVAGWADAVARVLADPAAAPPRATRVARAARFSWAAHARVVGEAYLRLAGGG